MAGLGNKGKRERRTGLVSEVTSQAEVEHALAEAEKTQGATGLNLTTEPPIEKVGWLLPAETTDRVRDAVAFLRSKGIQIDGKTAAAGALLAPAINKALNELEVKVNQGKKFPTSKATKAAKARRQ